MHDLWAKGWGLTKGAGGTGGEVKGENWDNCNSIINKIQFKRKKSWS